MSSSQGPVLSSVSGCKLPSCYLYIFYYYTMLSLLCCLPSILAVVAILVISLVQCSPRTVLRRSLVKSQDIAVNPTIRIRETKVFVNAEDDDPKKSKEIAYDAQITGNLPARDGGEEDTINSILEPWTMKLNEETQESAYGRSQMCSLLCPLIQSLQLAKELLIATGDDEMDFQLVETLEASKRLPTKEGLDEEDKLMQNNSDTEISAAQESEKKKRIWDIFGLSKLGKRQDTSKESIASSQTSRNAQKSTAKVENDAGEDVVVFVDKGDDQSTGTSEASQASYLVNKPKKKSLGASPASNSARKPRTMASAGTQVSVSSKKGAQARRGISTSVSVSNSKKPRANPRRGASTGVSTASKKPAARKGPSTATASKVTSVSKSASSKKKSS